MYDVCMYVYMYMYYVNMSVEKCMYVCIVCIYLPDHKITKSMYVYCMYEMEISNEKSVSPLQQCEGKWSGYPHRLQ